FLPDRSRKLDTRAGFFSPSLDGGLPLFELFNPSRRSSSAIWALSAATSAMSSSRDCSVADSAFIESLNRSQIPLSRKFCTVASGKQCTLTWATWAVTLAVLKDETLAIERIVLEAGAFSQWLYGALAEAGLPVVCVETRHMKAALSAQRNKTDRNDARGIAQMMRVGLYRPV